LEDKGNRTMSDCKSVDELLAIKNLTQEEFELHRDLIEECRHNEKKITECCAYTKENIERMADILDDVSEKMAALSLALQGIIGEAEDISLRVLPEDKFFHE